MESAKDPEKSNTPSESTPTEKDSSLQVQTPMAKTPAHGSAVTLTDLERYATEPLDRVPTAPGECEKSHPHPHASEEELKRLQHRIDLRLIPICSVLYLLCFLCRQNIGNAKTYHLLDTLPMTTDQYQLALSVFFFTYSTFDIPCNLLLRKLGPRIWLPLITLISGLVTACMGLVQNANSLIGVRLILGMCECGLFPGVAMLMTTWYVKKDVQFRQALFFGAAR